MNDSQLAADKKRPKLQSDLIDEACDQFEAAMRDGRQPRIEDFLEKFANLDRNALLQELIALEVELLGTKDNSAGLDTKHSHLSFSRYHQRFPEVIPALEDLQKDWALQIAGSSHSEGSSVELDPDAETKAPPVGDPRRRIKQFELQSILGHGGFGIVWRARDKRLQRDVAIKVPRPDRLALSDRTMFLREARAAAKLHHPNIIAIHEVGEHESEIYIVTELVEGVSLKTWLETQKMSPSDAASLIAKLAIAAQHAHDQRIVHRDLKPANVLIDKRGEPHVADFGLAKRDSGEESLSIAGQLMGTPAYMAPEQARGDHALIDARTDVYALGAIFYELLTGLRPFRAEMSILLEQVQHTLPPAPRQIKPEIPKELEAICLKCLAKDPAKRYPTAAALAEDLYLYQTGETLRGIPAALPHRLGKWLRRHRRSVAAVAVASFLSLTLAGGLAWQFRGTIPVPIELRKVAFITKPAGCEITVVTLDPKTGEPDPTKIQRVKGRTPLTTNLAAGDYLVVAVLDESRFQEVFRHVPPRDETIATAGPHRHWRMDSSGTVLVPEIEIPRPDVTIGMGFVEKVDELTEPSLRKETQERVWKLPSFYVDLIEISTEDIEKWGIERHGAEEWGRRKKQGRVAGLNPGPFSLLNYSFALSYLEMRGKRPPSAAEFYYLSTVVCPKALDTDEANRADVCRLPDNTRISGLHSGVWEWTSTRPGGLFSAIGASSNPVLTDALLKMIGGGDAVKNYPPTHTGFRPTSETNSNQIGSRGVRSAKPRLRPEDFIAPVHKLTTH
ncbi:MAG: Serine/threonine protein kinase PrkC, regulator of stationary phase [Planctomycetaceae bacterium]|nr:Serine/threonine protein kinase PrkC, regulator of stationary phase [Planctomycetaceae bacterium]